MYIEKRIGTQSHAARAVNLLRKNGVPSQIVHISSGNSASGGCVYGVRYDEAYAEKAGKILSASAVV